MEGLQPQVTTGDRIPPGRREREERWSPDSVRMLLPGRSPLSDRWHKALWRSGVVMTMVLMAVSALSVLPLPAQPLALSCIGDVQWTAACREVGPESLDEAVDPDEMARMLAANWDFEREDGLWRAGSAPFHVAHRAGVLQDGTDAKRRAAIAVRLAEVLEAPVSYGNWTLADSPELAATAHEIASLYEARAEATWEEHRASLRADWDDQIAPLVAVRSAAGAAWSPIGLLWLATGGACLLAWLIRLYAERPLRLELDCNALRVDRATIPLAAVCDIHFRWGRLELSLRDGSVWTSRPLEPRNPARLELMVMQRRKEQSTYEEESRARAEVHSALSGVLARVRR